MLVKIFENRFVPGIGHGPFNEPISISEEKFRLLKRMGINVVKIQPSVISMGPKAFKENYGSKKIEKAPEITNATKIEEEKVINEIKTPIIEEEITVEQNENTIDEIVETEEISEETEVVEEEKENEEKNNEDDEVVEEIDPENLTKKEIMQMLDEAGVEYSNTANKATLISLLEEIQ